MKKITLMILAAAVAAASCQKEAGSGADEGKSGRMTINAVSEGLAPATKGVAAGGQSGESECSGTKGGAAGGQGGQFECSATKGGENCAMAEGLAPATKGGASGGQSGESECSATKGGENGVSAEGLAPATKGVAAGGQSGESECSATKGGENGAMAEGLAPATKGVAAGGQSGESECSATKASAAYKYDVLWDEADKIMVKGQDGSDTFTLQEGAGTTEGKFTQDHDDVSFAGEVEAFYPASVASGEDLVWPAVQQNDPVPPLYTSTSVSGSTEDFSFSSLGAIFQIALSTLDGNRKLTKIELCDGAKPLSGKFTVKDGAAVITDDGGDDENDGSGSITLTLDNAELSGAASYFNIAVPAGKYDDLKLFFYTDDGCVAEMSSTTMPEIQRNTVARISLCINKFSKIPEEISLDKTSLNISLGCYYVLTPTVSPYAASVVWSSSDTSVASVDQDGKVTAKAVGKAVITATTLVGGLKASCNVTVTSNNKPGGALPALFRVSPQRQVYFSKGNLKCYDGADYQFEDAQYDYQESWDDMSVGHFYWLSDSYGAMLEEYESRYLANEFFTNDAQDIDEPSSSFHVAGQTGVFRNMSAGEWSFLLGDNEFRKGLYAIGVTVMGKTNCLIIYPDGYTGEIVKNGDTTTYSAKEGWAAAEEAGVVCLPAAGQREGSTISESGQTGRYWTGTRSASAVVGDYIAFDGSMCFVSSRYTFYGHAVRLVADY